jgi:hypothetical protein
MNEELFQKSYDTVKFDLSPHKYIDTLVQFDSDSQGNGFEFYFFKFQDQKHFL